MFLNWIQTSATPKHSHTTQKQLAKQKIEQIAIKALWMNERMNEWMNELFIYLFIYLFIKLIN